MLLVLGEANTARIDIFILPLTLPAKNCGKIMAYNHIFIPEEFKTK